MARNDEQGAGSDSAADAMHEPPDVRRQLLGLRTWQHHAVVQRMQEALFAHPPAPVNQFPMHHCDLTSGPAETVQPDIGPYAQGCAEGHAMAWRRRRQGGSLRASDRGFGCQLILGRVCAFPIQSIGKRHAQVAYVELGVTPAPTTLALSMTARVASWLQKRSPVAHLHCDECCNQLFNRRCAAQAIRSLVEPAGKPWFSTSSYRTTEPPSPRAARAAWRRSSAILQFGQSSKYRSSTSTVPVSPRDVGPASLLSSHARRQPSQASGARLAVAPTASSPRS